jgi:hypothetical protein
MRSLCKIEIQTDTDISLKPNILVLILINQEVILL